ncbi:hypothetical protein FQN54_000909 [Arachnomyces sp. PD_36]|nr:hypothetical protein FQN54_000909 [Arachnomyces sp. PD_36]
MPGGFHPPPSVIASWPRPNYVDPDSKGKELLVISLILTALAIVLVVTRLLVRARIQKQLGWDDYILALSLNGGNPLSSRPLNYLAAVAEFRNRWYRHIWDVPPQDMEFRQLHSWIIQLLFVISTSCTKASILLLYGRVIRETVKPGFMRVVKAAVALNFLYFIVYLCLTVFQCWPTQAYWNQFSFPDRYTTDYSCLYEGDVIFSNACVGVITDFLTALLPVFLFVQVQIPRRQKVSLAILFGVGFMVCILGVVRAVVVRRLLYETYDVTWYSYYAWSATLAENHIGIICAAIPPLRSLFLRYFGRISTKLSLKNDSEHNRRSYNNGGGYILHGNTKNNGTRGSKDSGVRDTRCQGSLEDSPAGPPFYGMSKSLPRISSGLSQGSIDTDILINMEEGVSGSSSRRWLKGNDF